MPIIQSGSTNLQALVVPDVYVDIIPPALASLNGVQTNILGLVGTATWGPVNTATLVSSYATYAQIFGPLQNRLYDVGTQVATAVQQGAQAMQVVRVTDGTDTAATVEILTSCLAIKSIYTGSFGNNTTVTISPGSVAATSNVAISVPGIFSENFTNIGGTGNAFWVNVAAAINAGQSAFRGPSRLVTATAGAGTTAAPTTSTNYSLTGGTDGATTITSAVLVGLNGTTRTGIYALANQGVSIAVIADMIDSTQWTTIQQFGLSQGIYFIACGPVGDNITNALSTFASSGAGNAAYSLKVLFGDWIFWNDPVNQVTRLVSPTGFAGGLYSNLSPEQSGLNKPLYSIVGTQKGGVGDANGTYSDAELTELFSVGIDVITNPVPGGNYYGLRLGHNCSSNAAVNGDNYTRLTNYFAATLNAGMGIFVGQPINSTLFGQVTATLNSFLMNALGAGLLGTLNGSLPFSVQCNLANNPFSQTSIGVLTANVNIQYQSIVQTLVIALQGGQSVIISNTIAPNTQS